jgi:hypothetical protein
MLKNSQNNIISHKECSLKVISATKISGKLNVTVRLVKTPPVPTVRKTSFLETCNDFIPVINKKSKIFFDPSDFIEPVPCFQEYMSNDEHLENELCETLPVLPRAYSIRPSVALRNSLRRKVRNNKHLFSPVKAKTQHVRMNKK